MEEYPCSSSYIREREYRGFIWVVEECVVLIINISEWKCINSKYDYEEG